VKDEKKDITILYHKVMLTIVEGGPWEEGGGIMQIEE